MSDALASRNELTKEAANALIQRHANLVKRIAHHLLGKLPASVQFDDLLQAGMLGLLEAARKFDDSKGASFQTYASIRIRGTMLDEVRRNDWVPRSVYRNARMVSSAVKAVEDRLGRDAKDHEVATELGLSLEEYHDILTDSAGGYLYTFEDLGVTEDVIRSDSAGCNSEPYRDALNDDTTTYLAQVIDGLPKNEKLVLSLYYEHDLNLKEIGDVLGVSESRVSQIHSQATHRVRARIPNFQG